MNYDFTLMLKEQIEELKKIDKFLEQNPHDKRALLRKSFLLLDGEDFENAVIAYEKVIELYPEHVDAYLWLAIAYLFTSKDEKMKEICQKGLRLDPARADLHLYLAYVLTNIRAIQPDAEDQGEIYYHLYKAIELEPAWIAPRKSLIRRLVEDERMDEAKKEAESALKNIQFISMPANDEVCHYEFAVTGRALEQEEEKKWFEDVIKNRPREELLIIP